MEDVVVVGGGPSGLAAAWEASKNGARTVVLERLDRVGGLARTLDFEGSKFDIGPHRFFTTNREVHKLFMDTVAEDAVHVPRLTRIFYNNKYFNYPLTPFNALFGVGPLNSGRILASYVAARGRRALNKAEPQHFEDWIVDRFGRRLFETFFKTYTEKVWGIPCTSIGADWAGQRIKGLSLTTAVMNALFKPRGKTIKTLVDEFVYPRLGAGQLYEKMARNIATHGSSVVLNSKVTSIQREGYRAKAVVVATPDGTTTIEGRNFLLSAPLTEIVEMMEPAAPPEVLAACRSLRYRNHVGVNLLVEDKPFPDNWIYIHSKEVGMARICNYANFSPDMASRPGLNPITVEYFTSEGDAVWTADDAHLRERAIAELEHMEILDRSQVSGAFVVRSEKAYPVIEIGYEQHISTIKTWLDRFENLLPIGRSGMFKYNNQDHAMYTGLLAARTVLGQGRYDPWLVNIDAEYHEGARIEAAAS
jgi:protoporphyrinogen oxidase